MDPESVVKARISRALSQWIAARHLTKSGLSDQTGIARQTIDDILDEKRLASTETLIKLAAFFEIMPGALVDGDKPPGISYPTPPASVVEKGSRSTPTAPKTDPRVLKALRALALAIGQTIDHVQVPPAARAEIQALLESVRSA